MPNKNERSIKPCVIYANMSLDDDRRYAPENGVAFKLTASGKIIKKPCRKAIVRERRKLKKQLRLYEAGEMSAENIMQSFESWAGSMKRRDARLTVFNMRRLLLKGLYHG